jgi:hypothetical protein
MACSELNSARPKSARRMPTSRTTRRRSAPARGHRERDLAIGSRYAWWTHRKLVEAAYHPAHSRIDTSARLPAQIRIARWIPLLASDALKRLPLHRIASNGFAFPEPA